MIQRPAPRTVNTGEKKKVVYLMGYVVIGNGGQASHEILRDERPQYNGSLARRDPLGRIPIEMDRYEYDRHLGNFLIAALFQQHLVD